MKVLVYGMEGELILEREARQEEILDLLRGISRNWFLQFGEGVIRARKG